MLCGKEYLHRAKLISTTFDNDVGLDVSNIDKNNYQPIELYSSYLGLVPVIALKLNENSVLLEAIVDNVNGPVLVKVIDMKESGLINNISYSLDHVSRKNSVCIDIEENLFMYYVTLHCYLRINEREGYDDKVKFYKEKIEEIKNEKLDKMLEERYNSILDPQIKSKDAKNILQKATLYNSRVDILFGTIEYLKFISKITNNKIYTINNQNVLVSVSGVPDLDNAFWNGKYMMFGNGENMFYPLTSIDVIGHELTHGLVQGICDLEYKGHSGALNESFADILGTMLEFYVYDTYKDRKLCGKADWCIGEDLTINTACLRNMEDPHKCKQPKQMYDNFYMDPNAQIDNGGVHINSGIPNYCFYLISNYSNDHYKTLILFLNCLYNLHNSSDFIDFSKKLIENAKDLEEKTHITKALNHTKLYDELTMNNNRGGGGFPPWGNYPAPIPPYGNYHPPSPHSYPLPLPQNGPYFPPNSYPIPWPYGNYPPPLPYPPHGYPPPYQPPYRFSEYEPFPMTGDSGRSRYYSPGRLESFKKNRNSRSFKL